MRNYIAKDVFIFEDYYLARCLFKTIFGNFKYLAIKSNDVDNAPNEETVIRLLISMESKGLVSTKDYKKCTLLEYTEVE